MESKEPELNEDIGSEEENEPKEGTERNEDTGLEEPERLGLRRHERRGRVLRCPLPYPTSFPKSLRTFSHPHPHPMLLVGVVPVRGPQARVENGTTKSRGQLLYQAAVRVVTDLGRHQDVLCDAIAQDKIQTTVQLEGGGWVRIGCTCPRRAMHS